MHNESKPTFGGTKNLAFLYKNMSKQQLHVLIYCIISKDVVVFEVDTHL